MPRECGLRAGMDDAQDLIDRLCTHAGMIMEDLSATAILAQAKSDRRAKIRLIRSAGEDIAALADAAEVLARRAAVP